MAYAPSSRDGSRPLVIGHRGAPGYRPEHSPSGYELAIALGADAVEPDVVSTSDGVLVVRHENEIGGTTDVADRPEFADRRTRKTIDGREVSGWFTEDFTWDELSTLRCRERLPGIRPESAAFDGREPILRLRDLLGLVRSASAERGRAVGVVLEIKHATYFASIGLPLDELVERELAGSGLSRETGLVIESFERSALTALRRRGVDARYVYLIERRGEPFDRVAAGVRRPYAEDVTDAGLAELATGPDPVDGVSVDWAMLVEADGDGVRPTDLVARAHAAGLEVFTWTLRPENRFLVASLRRGDDEAAFGDWETAFGLALRTGVDGAFFDHPDLGVRARRSLPPR